MTKAKFTYVSLKIWSHWPRGRRTAAVGKWLLFSFFFYCLGGEEFHSFFTLHLYKHSRRNLDCPYFIPFVKKMSGFI